MSDPIPWRLNAQIFAEHNQAEHGHTLVIVICRNTGIIDLGTIKDWFRGLDGKKHLKLLCFKAASRFIKQGKLPRNCFPIVTIREDVGKACKLDSHAGHGTDQDPTCFRTLEGIFLLFGEQAENEREEP